MNTIKTTQGDMVSKGIGTWNDESYIVLSPGDPGQPYRREQRRRHHLRWYFNDLATYQPVFDAFINDRRAEIASHIRTMKTNASDPNSVARDAELDILANLIGNTGATDWTIVLGDDSNRRDGRTFYIEVYRPV